MLISENSLRQIIRHVLLGESQEKSFLSNVIDNILKDSSFKVWLYDLGNKIRIGYDDEEKDENTVGDNKSKEIFGYIELSRYGSGKKAIAKGEKNSAWNVSSVRSKKGLGLGSLLYEIAIEYISNNKSASIMADPNFVKDDAKKIWKRFNNRSDILKLQLDIHKNRLKNLRKDFNDESLNQLTPDYLEDDVLMSSAIKDKGKEWKNSVLSKAYKKMNREIINNLEKKQLIIFLKK